MVSGSLVDRWPDQLPDGSWLEYLSQGHASIQTEIVAASAFGNEQIEFEGTPSGIRRLATISDVSGQRLTRLTHPALVSVDNAEAEPAFWFSMRIRAPVDHSETPEQLPLLPPGVTTRWSSSARASQLRPVETGGSGRRGRHEHDLEWTMAWLRRCDRTRHVTDDGE